MVRNSKSKSKRTWQEISKEAQDYRDATVAKIAPALPAIRARLPKHVTGVPRQLLSQLELQITESPSERLLSQLVSGKLTATAVTNAFLRRAGLAQKLTNCITELLPERALARAQFLDEYFAQNKKPFGPLHGLPISVKEMIGMKGLGLNAGYVAWWDNIAEEDAHVLQILWRAGAVFHARTTQPQSMMHLETDNNLYGVTVNPHNTDLSAGGSSGGEGALIGLRGSCLGVGSDIGGSIRCPAAHNGLYGFKPTAFRIPTDGWSSIMAGADPITTVIGPLSSSLSGIKLFMETVLSHKPWISEPALIPLPWNSSFRISEGQQLRIGVMWHDGVVTPHPPITRALQSTVAKLKALPNVSLIDWTPYLHDEAWAIVSSLYFTDGGADDSAVMAESGEPWRPLTAWMIKENPCVKKLSMQQLAYWQEEREEYRKEYAKAWNDTATGKDNSGELVGIMDVLLCAVAPGVAPVHDTSKYWGYTSQWNLLDYPAVVFPVTKVDPDVDVVDMDFSPMTDVDGEIWELYKPELFAGLPVALQLVGRRFEDEKVLAVLEYMQQEIGLPFEL